MTPDQITADDPRLADVLALIRTCFAYMDGIIDPPSSVHRLTLEGLHTISRTAEIWATPSACMILTPQDDTLYLGKLAVAEKARGKGLARSMTAHAVQRAKALKRPTLTLQTRIELTANHKTFKALGFYETARGAHEGYDHPTHITFVRKV